MAIDFLKHFRSRARKRTSWARAKVVQPTNGDAGSARTIEPEVTKLGQNEFESKRQDAGEKEKRLKEHDNRLSKQRYGLVPHDGSDFEEGAFFGTYHFSR